MNRELFLLSGRRAIINLSVGLSTWMSLHSKLHLQIVFIYDTSLPCILKTKIFITSNERPLLYGTTCPWILTLHFTQTQIIAIPPKKLYFITSILWFLLTFYLNYHTHSRLLPHPINSLKPKGSPHIPRNPAYSNPLFLDLTLLWKAEHLLPMTVIRGLSINNHCILASSPPALCSLADTSYWPNLVGTLLARGPLWYSAFRADPGYWIGLCRVENRCGVSRQTKVQACQSNSPSVET